MNAGTRTPASWNVLLLLGSIILGIVILESAARYLKIAPAVIRINPGSQESAFRFSDNPVLGYEWKAGFRDASADLHQSFPATNGDGFRDLERTRQKPPGKKRILLVGDSVAAGVGIRDIDSLISRQLEKRLAGSGYEVLNLGIPGYCTYGEVELLATRGITYQPDHVILLFVENDYVPGNFLFAQYTFEHPPGTEYLFLHSALFRWAALRWDWFNFGAAAKPRLETADDPDLALTRYSHGRFAEAVGSDTGTVTRALARLRELSDANGFRVTVAIWPRFSPSLILEGDHERAGGEILAVKAARDFGFPVVMLSEAFRADFARARDERGLDLNALDLYTLSLDDPMHPNEHGATIAAEALAGVFRRDGLSEGPGE
jgi:lysophospholipase L1-like esterase